MLADIESIALWNQPKAVLMDPKDAVEKLLVFLGSPQKPNALNDDHYLNLLQVAAAAITLAKEAKKSGSIREILLPLIYAKIQAKLSSAQLYRPSYCATLATHWSALHTALELLCEGKELNEAELIRNLSRHPHHSTLAFQEPHEASDWFKASEYLARKVGYWLKYYQESALHLDSKSEVKEELFRTKIREGTLFTLHDRGVDRLYEVRRVINHNGLVCQIMTPVDGQKDVQAGRPIPIKITFQGTIFNKNSLWRDKEVEGPGTSFWVNGGDKEVLQALRTVVEDEQKRCGPCTFAIEETGHSLGASDAQNGGSVVAVAAHSDPFFSQAIATLKVTTCNPAGISQKAAKAFADVVNQRPQLLEAILHSLVKGDVVQTSGETKLGAGVDQHERILLLESLNHCVDSNHAAYALSKHCNLVHANGPFILPMRVLHPHHDETHYGRCFMGIGQNMGTFFDHADHILQQHAVTEACLNLGKGISKTAWGLLTGSTFREIPELQRSIQIYQSSRASVASENLAPEVKKRRLEFYDNMIASCNAEIRRLQSLTPEELEKLREEARKKNEASSKTLSEGFSHSLGLFTGLKRALWDGGLQSLEPDCI